MAENKVKKRKIPLLDNSDISLAEKVEAEEKEEIIHSSQATV